MTRTHILYVVSSIGVLVNSQSTFPAYSQQCRDDAGPPFLDDEGTFCGKKYHEGSQAAPVLPESGECPSPVKAACESTGSPKQAFIEGPIDCGGNGWYCRILVSDDWPSENLVPDLNFGYCNTTGGFDDAGYDKSGHCHGGEDDSTYYWWMRDHWFRGYNGRLRCCCGWYTGGTDPVTKGRITNRCDYRRLVVDEADANNCRDANEDHGLGFEGGCSAEYASNVGSPLVEDDAQCWELHKFGYNENEYGDFPDCEGGGGGGGGGDEEDEENEGGGFEDDCFNDEEGSEEGEEGSEDDEEEEGSEDDEEEEGSEDDEEGSEDDEEEGDDDDEEEEEDKNTKQIKRKRKQIQKKLKKYLRDVGRIGGNAR